MTEDEEEKCLVEISKLHSQFAETYDKAQATKIIRDWVYIHADLQEEDYLKDAADASVCSGSNDLREFLILAIKAFLHSDIYNKRKLTAFDAFSLIEDVASYFMQHIEAQENQSSSTKE